MKVHYSIDGTIVCGSGINGTVYGPSFTTGRQRLLFGGSVGCIQHTCDPDFVTCKSCLRTRILKEKKQCERRLRLPSF